MNARSLAAVLQRLLHTLATGCVHFPMAIYVLELQHHFNANNHYSEFAHCTAIPRCANPEILRPRQSTDFDQNSATASADVCNLESAVSPRLQ